MKTVVFQDQASLLLRDTPPPEAPGPGEAQVRVHSVGICGTDLRAFGRKPRRPRVMGHEMGVEVVAIGPADGDTGIIVGDRCAVEPYLTCGHCIPCRRGRTNCCPDLKMLGGHLDGGMCELINVRVSKLHRAPSLSFDDLAMVEPLCIGAHAVKRARLNPGENVLVIGAGPIGLSVIQFAQLAGANVVVMEISASRIEFCRQQIGIACCIASPGESLLELKTILSGELPTTVFDATGSTGSMMRAFDYVAPSGALVFVGHNQEDITFKDGLFHRYEMTVMASRNAMADDFIGVINVLKAGKIDVTAWITNRASPEEIVAEFPRWLDRESGVIKAVLEL